MLDNAFATKRFTRNAAQQAIKQKLYPLSDLWKQNTRCLAINVLFDPPDCLLLLSYGVLTVTNPSDVLYKPVIVWPLSSAVICFQRISSPMR
jgi:hypothetical protein